jgi:hypothetical protein
MAGEDRCLKAHLAACHSDPFGLAHSRRVPSASTGPLALVRGTTAVNAAPGEILIWSNAVSNAVGWPVIFFHLLQVNPLVGGHDRQHILRLD